MAANVPSEVPMERSDSNRAGLPPTDNAIPQTESQQSASIPTNEGPARAPSQERWKPSELHLLISFKRQEHDLYKSESSRDRIKSADRKWAEIHQRLHEHNVVRTRVQVKKRWEKLLTDFKKVYDYQKHIRSGRPGYYEMGSEERKSNKLPPVFLHEYFYALESWVPSHRAVNPSPNQVHDSSQNNAGEDEADSSHPVPESQSSQHCPTEGPTYTPAEMLHPSTGRSDVAGDGNLQNFDPPDTSDYQLRKKAKSARLEDHFGKANQHFLHAMAKQADKNSEHDKELLEWDKQKNELDAKKHSESLAMQKEIGLEILGALRDVSSSFRFFAAELSKKDK